MTAVPTATVDLRPLHAYLQERAADRLVLTFREIEDLIGAPLPDAARLDAAWWNDAPPAATRSPQAESWFTADRAATVTMSSQRVLFERIISRATRPSLPSQS